jgi:energy-coupling factor transporter ATP-binding protein EcfA2
MNSKNDTARPNPFPGLRAFTPQEGHLFFGRMESTLKVVNRLIDNRFVAVLGPSGSGKSSLVMSGVLPALQKENANGKKTYSFLVFRPELNPVDNLAAQISALSTEAGFTFVPVPSVEASLHNRSEGLFDVINKIRKNLRQQIVIVIDQFEEIFRYGPASTDGVSGDATADFIDLLVSAARQQDEGLLIILTLRSEYVAECSRFQGLTGLLNSGSYLLPQLTRETMVSVIEEPVKLSGATIDRSVVRTIISDLGERTGQLPVLQHLLMRLWNNWARSGDLSRPLNMSDYESVGRIKGAISQHAGQAYNSLDERHKYVCSRLFKSITTRTEDGKELRKPEKISTIAALTGCTTEELFKVAEVFRAPEYSFITPEKEHLLTEGSIIDLTHESIIRLWENLKTWLEEEESSKRLYLQLAAAAALHQEGKGKLWTPPELPVAIKWRNEHKPTLEWAERLDPSFERAMLFLKNSEEKYVEQEEHNKQAGKKKIKRSRLFALILGLTVVVTLIALATTWSLKSKSEKQREIAMRQKEEVLSFNFMLADSLNNLTDTLKAASEAVVITTSKIASALERAETAEHKAAVAVDLREEAETDRNKALKIATEEKRKKMISIARSLAVRSLNYQDEKDLQVLLAYQGFIFNDRFQGTSNDADIYKALYDVGKRYGNRNYGQFIDGNVEVTAMAEEPSGTFFYTAEKSGRILQWQTDNPGKGYNVIWTGDMLIEIMTVSPDASWLACGTADSEIIMIPLSGGNLSYQMAGSGGNISALVFSNNGERLYSATVRGQVAGWDLASHTATDITRTQSGVMAMDISGDNLLLAGLTGDGKVLVWQIDSGKQVVILDLGEKVITSLRFVPWDHRLVTGDEAGSIAIWNTSEKRIADSFPGHDSGIRHIAFNRNKRQMATAGEEKFIKLWNYDDPREVPPIITDCNESIVKIGFSDNGKVLLAATIDGVTKRPAHVEYMTAGICDKVTRNLSPEEWTAFVGRDIEYENTCLDKTYRIRVTEIRGGK